ncbi:MAG: ribosomal protein S18-alanine N-acetyltransferase [Atopostipes sp.]|nr:ribosomal protein S18-alanine N-acetyltransferase [Atopostipes sp.]
MAKQQENIMIKELKKDKANKKRAQSVWEIAESAYNSGSPWTVKQFQKMIAAENTIILTAFLPNVGELALVVASQTMIEIDIYMVASKKNYQRKGIAKQLLKKLITRSQKKELKNIFLEVRKSNKAAYHLYQNLGFKEIGYRKSYYSKPKEDAIMMRFDL